MSKARQEESVQDVSAAVLERVFAHLRDVSEEAKAAAIRRDMPGFRKAVSRFGALCEETTAYSAEVTPVDCGGVPGEWVCDSDSDEDRRLLFIHGGSWMAGVPRDYRPTTSRIAQVTGCSVLAVEYRLAPEHRFPAGLDDCAAAYRWMLGHGPSGSGSAGRVFIAGDSAGGNLTFATMLRLRDEGGPLPDSAVPISAATDFTGSGESARTRAAVDPIIDAAKIGSTGKGYFRDRDPKDPLLSPLFGELTGLPPLLIQVGDAETLLDDSVRIADKARGEGVNVTLEVWPDMPHVWHVFAPVLPQATEAIAHIGSFVKDLCRA